MLLLFSVSVYQPRDPIDDRPSQIVGVTAISWVKAARPHSIKALEYESIIGNYIRQKQYVYREPLHWLTDDHVCGHYRE